jgi:hypothetical protein
MAAAVPPNLAKAIEAQQRLAAERPQDAAVFNDLGNLLLLVPQLDQAEDTYHKALELDPNKSSALYNLGLLLQQKGERKEAMELYQRLVKVEPSHAWGHYQLGTLYENAGQESKAIDSYAQAFALDPQLAFPEVNPQIVDNKLVTEAMLRAYKSELAPPQAPKIYEDPTRIAALLVPSPGAAKPTDEVATQQQEGAPAKTQQPGAAGQSQGATVLRERDLDRANPAGQAVPEGAPRGVGVPGMRTAPRALREWNRPEPTTQEIPNEGVTNEEVEPPGQVITPPPGGVYYRPGVPSTGRLGLQIVPERSRVGKG